MGASSSTLQVAVTDQVALVKISGRASFNCSVDFKTLVYELRDRGYHNFVLDLTECLIIDSTFLGVLAGFGLKLAESTGEKSTLTLLNPNPCVLDLLLQCNQRLVFSTQDEAMVLQRTLVQIVGATSEQPGPR